MLIVKKVALELSVNAWMDMKEIHLLSEFFVLLTQRNLKNQISIKTRECFYAFSCELNPCFNDPCGANADCDSRGRSAVCRCRSGYVGDPFVNCQLEPCSQNPCGTNAECESQGRSAICKCPNGYSGDPYTNCIRDPCSTNPCGEFS